MVALRAFCDAENIVAGMTVEAHAALAAIGPAGSATSSDVSSRSWPIRLVRHEGVVKWWAKVAVGHLAGEGFALSDDRFAVQRRVDSADAPGAADLLNELIDWRLARYLQTRSLSGGGAVVQVIQGGQGIILALRREACPSLPEGRGIRVLVDSPVGDIRLHEGRSQRRSPRPRGSQRARQRSARRLVPDPTQVLGN